MSHILNRQFANCYDELIRYYPRFYRDVREMVAILSAHGKAFDEFKDNIEKVYDNNFIDTMDEDTIAKLESFLGISLNKSRTLDERRRLLKMYFAGFGTVSASMLEEMIYAYTGAEVKISFEPFDEWGNNMLIIDIARGDEETIYMSDILYLLAKKIPAHIWYRAELWYDFPGIAIGGGRSRHTNYVIDYKLSGTIPENTLIGTLAQGDIVIDRQKTDTKTGLDQAEENGVVSGTKPDYILHGVAYDAAVAVKTEKGDTVFAYEISDQDGAISGEVPEQILRGMLAGAAAVIQETREETVFGQMQTEEEGTEAGIEPIIIKAGEYTEISAVTEATVSVGGVDYIFCGDGEYASQG